MRRANPGIQFYLTRIPHHFHARRFPDDGGPGPTRVNGGDLTSQHALTEPSGIGAQHGPAGGVELDDDSHARRNDVPRIHRAAALDGPTGLLQQQVVFRHLLTDGAAVVEAQTWIDRDAAPQSDGIAHERGRGDEPPSRIGWLLERPLRQDAVAVDRARTGREDGPGAMLAPVHLRADSPFVIGAEQPRPIVGQRALDRRANLLHLADQLGAAAPHVFGLIDADSGSSDRPTSATCPA